MKDNLQYPLENQRLEELERLNILDTEAEERFDKFTKLVSVTLDAPTVLISLIDANRQWFKSKQGLEETETPRDIAFCAHAIIQDSSKLIIPDAEQDFRFKDNPLVTGEPFVKAYAGIVLRSPNGLPLGTLCVFDYKPRSFEDKWIEALQQFASLVEVELYRNVSGEFVPSLRKEQSEDELLKLLDQTEFQMSFDQLKGTNPDAEIHTFFISLPKFQQISKTYGGKVGKELLNEIILRTKLGLSKWRFMLGRKNNNDIVGAIFTDPVKDNIDHIVRSLSETIGDRIQTPNNSIAIPILIGFSGVSDEIDLNRSLENASLACESLHYNISETQTCMYAEGMAEIASRRKMVASRLESALQNDQLELFFQPKVHLNDTAVCSAEVLIRWNDKDLGYVIPPEIIDAALDTGLLGELEKWIIENAIKQAAEWHEENVFVGGIAINITGETLQTKDFPSFLEGLLNKYKVDPKKIEFEILESAILNDLDEVVQIINKCKSFGVQFALDDFGTGQSSLHLLKVLPVDVLKIDRAFVIEIVNEPVSSALMHEIIKIGKTLNKQIVAEGVENMGQYLILRSLGCDIIQGYYFAKPMPANEFADLIKTCDGHIPPPGIENI